MWGAHLPRAKDLNNENLNIKFKTKHTQKKWKKEHHHRSCLDNKKKKKTFPYNPEEILGEMWQTYSKLSLKWTCKRLNDLGQDIRNKQNQSWKHISSLTLQGEATLQGLGTEHLLWDGRWGGERNLEDLESGLEEWFLKNNSGLQKKLNNPWADGKVMPWPRFLVKE